MSSIVDVVHRLSYEVDASDVTTVSLEFNKQLSQLTNLQAQLKGLQDQLKKTKSEEVEKQRQINSEIAKTNQLISQTEEALGREYVANKKLQEQFQQNIGYISELMMRQQQLSKQRIELPLTDDYETKLASITKEMESVGLELQRVNAIGSNTVGVINRLRAEISDKSNKILFEEDVDKIRQMQAEIEVLTKRLRDITTLPATQAPIPSGRIAQLQDRIKSLQETKINILVDESDIEKANLEIGTLQEEIKRLNALGQQQVSIVDPNGLAQQIGLIQQLEAEERRLLIARDSTQDTGEIKQYNKELFITRSRLQELRSTTASAAGGISRLQFAGSQLLREAPAFAFSLQTGILALSNNIPILLDEIQAAKQAGGSATSIFKELGRSIFSISGIITIVVAALTIFGDKIAQVFEGGYDYVKAYTEALKETNIEAQKEIATLQRLVLIASDAASTRSQAVDAIAQINKQYPELLKNINLENIGTQETNKLISEQIALLKDRAREKAADKAIEEGSKQLIESEEKLRSRVDRTGGFFAKAGRFFKDNFLEIGQAIGLGEGGGLDAYLKDVEESTKAIEDAIKRSIKANEELLSSDKKKLDAAKKGFQEYAAKQGKSIDDVTLKLEEEGSTYLKLISYLQKTIAETENLINARSRLIKQSPLERALGTARAMADQAEPGSEEAKKAQADVALAELNVEFEKLKRTSKAFGSDVITDSDRERIKSQTKFTVEQYNAMTEAEREYADAVIAYRKKLRSETERDSPARQGINTLPYQLLKEIEELQKKGNDLSLKGFVTTEQIIVNRLEAERKAALEEINIREEQAKAEGKLTAAAQLSFNRIKELINENYQLQIFNDTEEFNRKRLQQQEDFNIQLQQQLIRSDKEALELLNMSGEENLKLRISIGQEENQLLIAQENSSYRRLQETIRREIEAREKSIELVSNITVEERERLNEEISKLRQQEEAAESVHNQNLINIRNRALQTLIGNVKESYEQNLKNIRLYEESESAAIDEAQSDAIRKLGEAYRARNITLQKFLFAQLDIEYEANKERAQAEEDQANKRLDAAKKNYADLIKAKEDYIRKLKQKGLTEQQATEQADADYDRPLTEAQTNVSTAATQANQASANNAAIGRKPNWFEKFMLGKDAYDVTDPEIRRQKAISESIDLYKELANAALETSRQIADVQIQAIDREVEYRQSRIDYAVELAKRGNVELLNSERERLEQLQKKREEIAQRQLVIDAVLRASSAALTIAQSLQTVANAGSKGDPYSPAVRIAAAVAALAAGFAAVMSFRESFSGGFSEGGYTGDGGKYQPAGIVHKGEVVFSQKDIARLGGVDVVEKLRLGALPVFNNSKSPTIRMDTLEKKMDTLISVVSEDRTVVHNRMDERGWLSMTERARRRDMNRFR